jgi:hypothetical protein
MPIPRKYVIIFGDVDEYIKHINRPVDEHVVLTPLIDIVRKKYPQIVERSVDLLDFFKDIEEPVSITLLEFFKDRAELVKSLETRDDEMFEDEEEWENHWFVYSVAKEFMVLNYDVGSMNEASCCKASNFPEKWEKVAVPLLMKDGSIAELSEGFANILDMRAFSYNMYREVAKLAGDEGRVKLPYHSIFETESMNNEALHNDPDVKFSIYVNPNWVDPVEKLREEREKEELKPVELSVDRVDQYLEELSDALRGMDPKTTTITKF